MRDFFQMMAHNQIILSVVSIVFGIVFIVWQAGAVAGIIRILGVVLLIGAAFGLITYFFGRKNKGNASTLASAILCIVVGAVFAAAPQWLIVLFPLVMGVILVICGIFNASALIAAPVRTAAFPAGVALTAITLVLGVIALIRPGAVADVLVVLLGVAFLLNGVGGLVTVSLLGDGARR